MNLIWGIKNATSLRGLVIRAAIFGLAWLLLPFWLFLLIALYFYFRPFFRPLKLFFPFLMTLFFAFTGQPGFLSAVFLSVLFYLLLGIKDLVFVDRKSSHEVLIMLLMFLTLTRLFSYYGSWGAPSAFFCAFAVGIVFFILANSFASEYGNGARAAVAGKPLKSEQIIPAIAALASWQLTLAAFFLPLNFLYQSALTFLSVAILLELISDHLGGALTRRRILVYFSAFSVFFVLILGMAQWTL